MRHIIIYEIFEPVIDKSGSMSNTTEPDVLPKFNYRLAITEYDDYEEFNLNDFYTEVDKYVELNGQKMKHKIFGPWLTEILSIFFTDKIISVDDRYGKVNRVYCAWDTIVTNQSQLYFRLDTDNKKGKFFDPQEEIPILSNEKIKVWKENSETYKKWKVWKKTSRFGL